MYDQQLPHWKKIVPMVACFLTITTGLEISRFGEPAWAAPPMASMVATEDIDRLQEAERYASMGEADQAIVRYQDMIRVVPHSPLMPEVWFKLAELLYKQQRRAEANHAYGEAARYLPMPFAQKAQEKLAALTPTPPTETHQTKPVFTSRSEDNGFYTTDATVALPVESPPAQPNPPEGQTANPPEAALPAIPGEPGAGLPAPVEEPPFPQDSGTSPWPPAAARFDLDTGRFETVEAYFAHADPTLTARFLRAFQPHVNNPEWTRILLIAVARQPLEKLQLVLSLQPAGGFLTPFLQLGIGDKLALSGEEEIAQEMWSEAAQSGANLPIGQEARHRLEEPSETNALSVGILLPLSGKYASLGQSLLQSARQALDDYRDVAMILHPADSGGDPQTTTAAVDSLVQKGVNIIVGPIFQEEARAAAVAAAGHGMPIIVLNPRQEILQTARQVAGKEGIVFLNAFRPDQQAREMARFALQQQHRQRAVVLAPQSDAGELTARAFQNEFESQGGVVVDTLYFDPNVSDFSPWIKVMKRLYQDPATRFEVLFMPGRADQARLLAPQLSYVGMRQSDLLFLGTSLWNRPELLSEGVDYLQETAFFCDGDLANRRLFETAFERRWKEKPASLSPLSYDSVAMLGQLLRDRRLAGPDWQNGLTRVPGFSGASGQFNILPDGAVQHHYGIFVVGEKGFENWYPGRISKPASSPDQGVASTPEANAGAIVLPAETIADEEEQPMPN